MICLWFLDFVSLLLLRGTLPGARTVPLVHLRLPLFGWKTKTAKIERENNLNLHSLFDTYIVRVIAQPLSKTGEGKNKERKTLVRDLLILIDGMTERTKSYGGNDKPLIHRRPRKS